MQWFLCLLAQSQETLLSFGYLFMLLRSLKLRKARGRPSWHKRDACLAPAGLAFISQFTILLSHIVYV